CRLGLRSFPTRRSSDLVGAGLCYRREDPDDFARVLGELIQRRRRGDLPLRSEELFPTESWEHQSQPLLETLSRHIGAEIPVGSGDRKSTRLNSSHGKIS